MPSGWKVTPMVPILVLLSVLVGVVLGLLTWGLLRLRGQSDHPRPASSDGVLFALLALAAFALGAFVTYALLGLGY